MKSMLVISMFLCSVMVQARPVFQASPPATEFHVDPVKGNGSSAATGSIKSPFKKEPSIGNMI